MESDSSINGVSTYYRSFVVYCAPDSQDIVLMDVMILSSPVFAMKNFDRSVTRSNTAIIPIARDLLFSAASERAAIDWNSKRWMLAYFMIPYIGRILQ